MKNTDKIIKLVTAALMASITCVVTMLLKIPVPNTNGGYIHPGDAFVILSGIILGPLYGGLAAGIGSMFADLFAGYAQYMFFTLAIKLLAAVAAAYSYRHIRKHSAILAGVFAAIIVTPGYLIVDSILSGNFGAGLAGVPFNLLQNITGIVLAFIILPLLKKVPQIKAMMDNSKAK
jgi:uncharacterized membrane protein